MTELSICNITRLSSAHFLALLAPFTRLLFRSFSWSAVFERMWRLISQIGACCVLVLIGRKVMLGHTALHYLSQCRHSVSAQAFRDSPSFNQLLPLLPEDALLLIMNKFALNMTLNWLCNTVDMDSVHERLVLVVLDRESRDAVSRHWSAVRSFYWPVPCLQKAFNYGEGSYQLFYLLRANLAVVLAESGKSFWMIQQDTFWNGNLLQLNLSQKAHILFDVSDRSDSPVIAGGYFYVKATNKSIEFFTNLANQLSEWYAPDNALMTWACSNDRHSVCGYIPFHFLSNWKWLHEKRRWGESQPYLIQFDGDTQLSGKLAKMKSLHLYFLQSDGYSCNRSAVREAQTSLRTITNRTEVSRSWSQLQLTIYDLIAHLLTRHWTTNLLLRNIILPYSNYLMITI